jgi:hypothetical protein
MHTSIHEAGHAVERHRVHGTTGAIRPEPLPGKEAGAKMEPLPPNLCEPNPLEAGTVRLRNPPYTSSERTRLEQEIKTALAGSVAEGINWGRDPLETLGERAQASDARHVYGIAKKLWPDPTTTEREVARLAAEVEADLDSAWEIVVKVAEAYEAAPEGLTAEEVGKAMDETRK